ncbi:MAG TPA: 30S ribosomal protein S20 [Anaeromyxobacteraceae bacterium]|nr:30S ribosomal protein S20 [Anaeromyxobacteraceae bacterium]
MANTASSEKRNRQTQKRHDRNVAVRSSVKTAVKKLREALDKGDLAAAKAALPAAEKALASAASKGVLHKNAASRRISRLAHAVAKTAAPAK